MMRPDPIQEQDILIGQYTLGLLSPQETHRVQALLARDPAAARTALRWEESFLTLVDALPPVPPSNTILVDVLTALDLPFASGIERVTQVDPEPANHIEAAPETTQAPIETQPLPQTDRACAGAVVHDPGPESVDEPARQAVYESAYESNHDPASEQVYEPARDQAAETGTPMAFERKRRTRRVWFGSAAAVVLLALLTLAFMPRQPAEPPLVIVEVAPSKGAILQAPGQSSTPGWVVTIDLENNVTLTPQVHTDTPAQTSVQLWTYNKSLPQPRSLGLIDPNQPVAIPSELMGEIGDDQFFEMTLEPAGGSPHTEPSGPILFIGRVVTFS